MAIQLPFYERQVREAPLQAARVGAVSSAQGLAELGQGVRQAGNAAQVVAQHIDRQNAKADALRIDVASQQLLQQKQQLLEDQNGGFLTQSGENAIKQSQSYKDQFDNIAKRLGQDLSPSQRAQFESIALSEATSFSHAIDQHVAKQSDALEQQTATTILNAKANEASSAALTGDHVGLEDAISAGLGHLDKLGRINGWTPEIRKAKEQEYTSSTRLSVIESVLGAGQPEQAQQYLKQWGSELNQNQLVQSKLRERIDAGVAKNQADEIATTAWSMSKNDLDTAEQHIASVESIDPRVRDLAIATVRKRADQYVDDQKKADSGGLARIGEAVARGAGKFTMADLDAHPDFVRMNLQESKTKAVQMAAAAIRQASNDQAWRRIQAEMDATAESEFRARAANDPDGAAEVDVDSEFPHVTQRSRNAIKEKQGKLRTDIKDGQAVKTSEFMRMVNSRIGPQTPKKVAETIRDNMLQWYDGKKGELKGKEPPLSEAQKYLDDQFTTVESGHWYQKNLTRAESIARGRTTPPAASPTIPPKSDEPQRAATPKATDVRSAPKVLKSELVPMRGPNGQYIEVPKSQVNEALKRGATVVNGGR